MAERLKLGQVLVQRGACPPQSIDAALNNQVLFGGTLGTNLLELGLVSEAQLAAALGQLHGLPFHAGDLSIDPAVSKRMSAELVERTEIVPISLEGTRLQVLVGDPNAIAALDEVAFATGLKIVPIVAAEERVWSLMKKVYGVERQFRALAVDRPVAPAQSAKKAEPVEDLMSEAEFNEMYARKREDAPRPEPVKAETEEDLPEIELLEELLPEAEVVAEPEAPPPELSPLSFDEAVRALDGVVHREAIAQTVLRYARSKFKRAVLLTVRGAVADGWEGIGTGLTPQRVKAIRIRLGVPSVFETVVSAQAHYLGPMLKTEENLRFLKALAGGAPKGVFLIPILVGGRVVNVLYADNGRGGQVDADVGELLILAAKIAKSYDALLARRR
jgi:hypothetical protein